LAFWLGVCAKRKLHTLIRGAVIVWDVLAAPPPDLHHLTFHTMASKTPYAIKFAEEERGKTVYIAAAWQNERGNVGQWSEILSAVIP